MTPTWKAPGLRGHSLLSMITQLSPLAAGGSRMPTRDLYLVMTYKYTQKVSLFKEVTCDPPTACPTCTTQTADASAANQNVTPLNFSDKDLPDTPRSDSEQQMKQIAVNACSFARMTVLAC